MWKGIEIRDGPIQHFCRYTDTDLCQYRRYQGTLSIGSIWLPIPILTILSYQYRPIPNRNALSFCAWNRLQICLRTCEKCVEWGIYKPAPHTIRVSKNFHAQAGYSTFYPSRPEIGTDFNIEETLSPSGNFNGT